MPIAKSKEFQLKLVDHTPKEELRAMEDLLKEYHVHLSATSHHLYKEYLQSSDVGEAAQKEALRAQEEHENLVRENEAENQRVRELREQRLKREFDQRDEQIRGEVSQAKEDEAERVREADQIVKETEAILAHRIDRKDFEGTLLEALDHPVDHEYAIDLEVMSNAHSFFEPHPHILRFFICRTRARFPFCYLTRL